MDFIMLATLFVVVLIQIIILITQQKNGKLVRDFIAQKNSRNFQSDRGGDRPDRFHDRNNNGNRQSRPPRTEQESRPRPPQSPAEPVAAPEGVVDNMEKSLRDINLKLKNAERDQEVARRKFQDNGVEGAGRDQSRRRNPQENRDGNRGGRDGSRGSRDGGRGGRDENRGGRDENRDHRRGGGDRDRNNRNNWRDRNQDRPFQEERQAEASDTDIPATSLPMEADIGAITAPIAAATAPEMNASDFDSDNTEHGRKIMVKRRMINDDQPGENASSDSSTAASDASSENISEKPSSDAGISFGRR